MAIVKAAGLKKAYGSGDARVLALDGVDIEVEAGEFVSVMGPSGCGKSTLLHLLGGLDSIDSGDIEIAGQGLASLNDKQLTLLRRKHIGIVFQYFNLVPVLSALENVALPLVLSGKRPRQAQALAMEWLERFDIGARAKHLPAELSGGQQQRVALARALIMEPSLILGDEPTGNLDSLMADEVVSLLKRGAKEFGRAVLMVTHDPRMAAYADRIVLMKDGKIAGESLLSQGGA